MSGGLSFLVSAGRLAQKKIKAPVAIEIEHAHPSARRLNGPRRARFAAFVLKREILFPEDERRLSLWRLRGRSNGVSVAARLNEKRDASRNNNRGVHCLVRRDFHHRHDPCSAERYFYSTGSAGWPEIATLSSRPESIRSGIVLKPVEIPETLLFYVRLGPRLELKLTRPRLEPEPAVERLSTKDRVRQLDPEQESMTLGHGRGRNALCFGLTTRQGS